MISHGIIFILNGLMEPMYTIADDGYLNQVQICPISYNTLQILIPHKIGISDVVFFDCELIIF